MSSDEEILLSDICEAIVDCEHKTASSQMEGIPLIRTTDIENGKLKLTQAKKISESIYKEWSKRLEPEAEDIILAREAPVGEVGYVPKGQRVCLGQRTVLIRINPKLAYPRYILYRLCSKEVRQKMASLAAGSVVSHLNMEDIRILPIGKLPSLDQQRIIGDFLGALDDKIEVNQRMNITLEAVGQAVFKRWFVDFEFPNKEGKPYKLSGGEMVDSELGQIPKGWEVMKLGKVVRFLRGVSYTSEDLGESENALVSLKSFIRGGGFSAEGLKPFTGKCKEEQILHSGDIVVAHTDLTQKAEVLGKPALIRKDPKFKILVASMDLGIVRPIDRKSNSYIYYLLKSENFQNHIVGYANGTTVLHLSNKGVPEYLFAYPWSEVTAKFGEIVDNFFIKIEQNCEQSEVLIQLREILLPKLMSGKIRVLVSNDNMET
jgi:type I restriction enzyme S subunit